MQDDGEYLYQGGSLTLDGNVRQPSCPTSEPHFDSRRSHPPQDLLLGMDTQVWDRTIRPAISSAQAKDHSALSTQPSSEFLSPSPLAALPLYGVQAGANSDTQGPTSLGDQMSIVPELESCKLCPYKGSAQRIRYV